MPTTYSPLSDADDTDNQLDQLLRDFQELQNTVREQNTYIEEQKDEINELITQNRQDVATRLTSLESRVQTMEVPVHSPSQNNTPESSVIESRQLNNEEPYSCYRSPCSLVYISYACRLLFTIFLISTLILDGVEFAMKLIASTFLFFSVLTLFSGPHKKESPTIYCIRIIGWLVNLAGAIAFFTQGSDSFYNNYYSDVNKLLSFSLLAYGHSIELVHLLLFKERFEHKAYTISLSCCIAGFLLPIFSENWTVLFVAALLLIIHAFAQYVGVFCERPPPGVPTCDDTVQENIEPLPDDMLDSYAFMMVSNDATVWNFGFLISLIQISLANTILVDQFFLNEIDIGLDAPFKVVLLRKTGIPFDAPLKVPLFVTFAQFIGLFLSPFWETDIITSIKALDMFWFKNKNEWPHEEIHAKDGTYWIWLDKVFLPNALRLVGGVLVLGTSFVIIVKSESIMDLFKDFTALILISQIDNIAFSLADKRYFGDKLKDASDKVKRIRVNDNSHFKICGVPSRLFAVLVISACSLSGWSYFVYGQTSGAFFYLKYPNCTIEHPTWIEDGLCHGGEYNTAECDFDGGDCAEFNMKYPNCNVEDPTLIGDGLCHGGEYNTAECDFDGDDCAEFHAKYPNCNIEYPTLIGDGLCHVGEYNTAECDFDGGDCV